MKREEHLLIVLSEECAEVIKEVAKSLRFGVTDCAPNSGVTNGDKIVHEIGDVIAVYEMLCKEKTLDKMNTNILDAHIRHKQGKVEEWLKYSEKNNRLN